MKIRSHLFPVTLFLVIFSLSLNAQPLPCGVNPAMTSTCAPACVICDIDGFTGINSSQIQGQAPPGFCTTQIHHMQWIAFIAGTPNIEIAVQVFNCQLGLGLEIGIYQSLNCQNFTLVSNCNTDVDNNSTATFTNTVPLTVGQYYYFVMDGSGDDVCRYTITVLQGSTEVSPLTTSGSIAGPAEGCTGTTSQYTADTIVGATQYRWTLNNTLIGTNQSVSIDWTATGSYELCVKATNACDEATPSCRTILIEDIPPTIIEQAICEDDCFDFADTTLCDPGVYEFHYTVAGGCDSMVQLILTENLVIETDLSFFICEGDSIPIGNSSFSLPGQYDVALTSVNGCDSIIHLSLNNIVCEMQGDIAAGPVRCFGENSGSLTFAITDGTPPFTYTWARTNGNPSGTGGLANANQAQTINNMPPGVYLVNISDGFGNDVVLIAEISEPQPLALSWSLSDYNGVNISCFGGQDGLLEVLPQGGTSPYSFIWDTGNTSAQLNGMPAGIYTVTVTDSRGCLLSGSNLLDEPAELLLAAVFTDPNCEGPETGSIGVSSISGGIEPYLYELKGQGFGADSLFTNLYEGPYTLIVQDANGCTADTTAQLVAAAIPQIDAGEDVIIALAESTPLRVIINLLPDTIQWSPPYNLSCIDCPDPVAAPYHTTTYNVSVTSADDCITSDSVTVLVAKIRDVFIPNVFSPNADGINDLLSVFAGPEVRLVKSFKVFSRWGELVYELRDFAPNDSSVGWNGEFRGKPMPQGIFVYLVDLEFIDDEVISVEGDVMLVR
ncbi:MAG: gliding motility-associated C-terminal domain-containing protein [Saprospiraceae bacterium]|nr:gliding motility-associated C-terminal domain-containing protein [Saprospiraceae bacterium]